MSVFVSVCLIIHQMDFTHGGSIAEGQRMCRIQVEEVQMSSSRESFDNRFVTKAGTALAGVLLRT